MKIYAVIVTYNPKKWLHKCFDSLVTSTAPVKIIVVDNGSADGSQEIIRKEYPQIDFIQSEKNLGFGGGNNIGMKKAISNGAQYVFLLNQDAWIERDTIKNLISAHQNNPEYGIISPIHLNGSGTNIDLNFANFILNEKDYSRKLLYDLLMDEKLASIYETNFINAAAWLIPRICLEKVRYFDSKLFFMYGEDNNYINRAKYFGFKVGIVPETFIYHDRDERKGKRSITTNNDKYEITAFKVLGSDITNNYFNKSMFSSIKLNFVNAVKKFIKLKFLLCFREIKACTAKIKLYPLILKQRKSYYSNNES